MLINNDVLQRIDELIEQHYTDFAFQLIGDQFLNPAQRRRVNELGLIVGRRPLLELLYMIVRLRPTNGYDRSVNIDRLLDEVSLLGTNLVVNDTHQYTLDHARASINQAIEAAKDELKKKLSQKILEANRKLKQQIAVERITSLEERRKAQNLQLLALLAAFFAIRDSVQNNFIRDFTSHLTDVINDAAVDTVTAESVITGEDAEDTLVYKKVINDGSLCQWCRKFYVGEDGEPILYTLKELQANGTNDGKPKNEWKPVIGKTHARCRCQLLRHRA